MKSLYQNSPSPLSFEEKGKAGFLYLLELPDYATPSFVSFQKTYFTDEKNAKWLAAQEDSKKITPAKLLHWGHWVRTPYSWTHINIWNCPYHMECDSATAVIFWLEAGMQWYRAYSAAFQNLHLQEKGRPIGNMLWGHPGAICYQPPWLFSTLLFCEKRFATSQEAEADYERFLTDPEINFQDFCNDIFGDG